MVVAKEMRLENEYERPGIQKIYDCTGLDQVERAL